MVIDTELTLRLQILDAHAIWLGLVGIRCRQVDVGGFTWFACDWPTDGSEQLLGRNVGVAKGNLERIAHGLDPYIQCNQWGY